jgi:hypothetical protein
MLLSCELRMPIEKSACVGMTVRVITYLVGQGQAMGHRRSKAVARPPSPRILVVEIGKLYLFVPAAGVLAHKTSPPLGHRQSAPLVLVPLPPWQSDQEVLVGQNQKQKRRLYAKRQSRPAMILFHCCPGKNRAASVIYCSRRAYSDCGRERFESDLARNAISEPFSLRHDNEA